MTRASKLKVTASRLPCSALIIISTCLTRRELNKLHLLMETFRITSDLSPSPCCFNEFSLIMVCPSCFRCALADFPSLFASIIYVIRNDWSTRKWAKHQSHSLYTVHTTDAPQLERTKDLRKAFIWTLFISKQITFLHSHVALRRLIIPPPVFTVSNKKARKLSECSPFFYYLHWQASRLAKLYVN